MKLLIATRNRGKLEEIRFLFDLSKLKTISVLDLPVMPEEVEEDGQTFEENARKKALELALETGLWTLADDSGLEVDALNGAPGVYSARYAGDDATDEGNNIKLLEQVGENKNRQARFCCVIALCSPAGHARVVEGACKGAIAERSRGNCGFGYDPLFVPWGETKTFAELTPEKKHALSHRGVALKKAKKAWKTVLSQEHFDGEG
ncbi:MAG: XTP/dITP diphosphatase [Kiritimatiellae bacterium]|nr:XTP/dITP diphosphatase [Kiritimatiellia bacterium]